MQDLLDFLTLKDANVTYVVLGMILLGASSGIVGTFTFLRKRALVGDAIAHAVLPGICLSFMLTGVRDPFLLLIGATATGWLSLLVIDGITRNSRIPTDASIGLTLSVFFGFGILLLTAIQKTGNASQSGLDHFLFGKAAALVGSDVMVFAVMSALLIAVVWLLFKEFALLSFDPDYARSIGRPVRSLELVLASITVLAVSLGIQAVGVVLMSALLITPAAAARYWTNRLGIMVVLAAFFGAISGVFGAGVSYIAPSMPTGPWVVVILSVIAIASMLFAPERGVLARSYKQWKFRRKIQDENVLKEFYHIAEKNDGDIFSIRNIVEISGRRGFSTRPLKQSLKRLTRKGLLSSNKASWQLTEEGINAAKRLVRIHRLWEVYLSRHLNIADDHVHDDAEAMEHIITPELEKELLQFLDQPETDPHGSSIPY